MTSRDVFSLFYRPEMIVCRLDVVDEEVPKVCAGGFQGLNSLSFVMINGFGMRV
jgi:hypothetical protein